MIRGGGDGCLEKFPAQGEIAAGEQTGAQIACNLFFFDDANRLAPDGDPLHRPGRQQRGVPAFRPLLRAIHQKQRKSSAGRKPHDVTRMFKMLPNSAKPKCPSMLLEPDLGHQGMQEFDRHRRRVSVQRRIEGRQQFAIVY